VVARGNKAGPGYCHVAIAYSVAALSNVIPAAYEKGEALIVAIGDRIRVESTKAQIA